MIEKIFIPQAFENMEEATIGGWSKREGDLIAIGDALCELITEKTTFDLPAEAGGTLLKILAPEKSIVPVGFVIALCGEAGDETGQMLPQIEAANAALQAKRNAAQNQTPAAPALSMPPVAAAQATPAAASRVRATPAARRVARERGVAIEDVARQLPNKVLSEDDVLKFNP